MISQINWEEGTSLPQRNEICLSDVIHLIIIIEKSLIRYIHSKDYNFIMNFDEQTTQVNHEN